MAVPPAPPPLPLGRGLLYAGFAASTWGTAGAAATALHQHSGLGPLTVSFWRFLIGALLLLGARPLLLHSRSRRVHAATPACGSGSGFGSGLRRLVRPHLLGLGLCMAVFQTFYLIAVDLTGLAVGTTVALGTTPVLTSLGAWLLSRQRPRPADLSATALAVVGLLLVVLGGSGGGSGVPATGPSPVAGFACALLSAAGLASVNLLGQRRRRRPDGEPLDAALAGFGVGTVLLLPVLLTTDVLPKGSEVWPSVLLLGYLAAVPSALAYALFFTAASVVRATTMSTLMLLEPLAALALGVLLFDERLALAAAAGTALLLTGILVLARAERESGNPGPDGGATHQPIG
ncbi:EamA family transporter [Streptomyces luteolus]|uniref:EamA family transporter n=1 Tax=Streptomyces luteolus TaxID=3043615 RepID=A0ABT6SQA6_9ACTN|nr:EamA family transporter [Streptomyces sp. B-S-A12]MDI3417750.1 EamA family transporter [Streptomyces sp. B-S-A12]